MTEAGRLLFVASEVYPLVKTGGLADVAGSLPVVLQEEGMDVRILLPAYGDVLEQAGPLTELVKLELDGEQVAIMETELPGTRLTTWLLLHSSFSQRSGNPYHDEQGEPWLDNAERFMLLSRIAAAIALGETPLDWTPDVLHCNDWHTGPAIALVHQAPRRPRTVFTIHNLAHMGMFDRATFERLQLPEHFWSGDGLEFYDQLCFIKGGLVYADWITTVSPSYAEEICHAPGGMGLEGLLSHRRDHLVGILNGIDETVWDPATDPLLIENYTADCLAGKAVNKTALQQELGLEVSDDIPLFGFVGRLAEQKGLDLLLPLLDELLQTPAQLVVLGTGDPGLEQLLGELEQRNVGRAAVILAYNETMAHKIEASADVFLMPSLFEPCGLNQMYSLRYGTLPLVRAVGGLADTVIDATRENRAAGTATGFVFEKPEPEALQGALQRALHLWADRVEWRRLQVTAMAQDFSWQRRARQYLELYLQD
jgi:starch synthase